MISFNQSEHSNEIVLRCGGPNWYAPILLLCLQCLLWTSI
jgi:hypothetical protein